jgi:3-isopropylmalate/(R)-2-methylmalate dehydratase small subunit
MPSLFSRPFTSAVLPLDVANVDTDAIIPKQFLQTTARGGLGGNLFHYWRFLDEQGIYPNPDFVLNKPEYQGAGILLARENFGCGSSREHAPWALLEYGFKVVISSSFADIFSHNAFNNQLLLLKFSPAEIEEMFNCLRSGQRVVFRVDAGEQILSTPMGRYRFALDYYERSCLFQDLNSIARTMEHEETISAYERRIPAWLRTRGLPSDY